MSWRLGDSRLRYNGRIERRAAEIDPASGGVEVYARVAGAEDIEQPSDALRPGAFVEISLADISYPNVVALPKEALVSGGRIFSVSEDKLQTVRVEVVRQLDEQILVRGDIVDDTPVVVTPFASIGPGVRVRVLPK